MQVPPVQTSLAESGVRSPESPPRPYKNDAGHRTPDTVVYRRGLRAPVYRRGLRAPQGDLSPNISSPITAVKNEPVNSSGVSAGKSEAS
jgi:hypothetical protein